MSGGNPAQISDKVERQYSEYLIRADYAVMRDAVYHKYRRWLLTGDGDPDGLLDVMEEVKGY
ncbi:MAG: hypothetical protein IT365_11220, partial [Candidatus Hydrogenedentes bacterium]|nr:hypothetical protein [Candidatus Hydrogenedentota bacterium]